MFKADAVIPLTGRGSKITPKQLSFVDEYFVDLVITKAVERSMFKTKNPKEMGRKLMQNPHVMAEIAKRSTLRAEKHEIKADYLINKLVSIIEATQEDNPQAALRAIELAGKSIALWKERQEISGPDGHAIEMEQRVKEDVADLQSKLASIAQRTGTDGITFISKPRITGES